MSKISNRIRMIFIFSAIAALLVLSFIQLMKIQVVDGESYRKQSIKKTLGVQHVSAPRGEIVDINGNPIVKNHAGFSIVIQDAFFPEDVQQQNDIILQVINILKKQNAEWIDELPITKTEPYTYLDGKDSEIKKVKSNLRLNDYATADNVMDKLISTYKIADSYTAEEKRDIAGVRYQMVLKEFSISNDYIFAKDVPTEVAAVIKELAYKLKGLTIAEDAVRTYTDSTLLPHVVGTVGPIYAEEYKDMKSKGYSMNAVIGKSGIEKTFEDTLRGTDGKREVTISPDGSDVEMNDTQPAVSGNTLKLTIDSTFQKNVQDILANTIATLNSQNSTDQKTGVFADAGAFVVLDAKTGAVKALATYPSYDINDYITNYDAVKAIPNDALVNRAINGLYRPGSTFKPITATAVLNEGKITPNTTYYCSGTYQFHDITKNCWKHSGHGSQNVEEAIKNSCNIFFYNAVQTINIDTLIKYEKIFGLGVKSDLEIGGATGYLAGPETKERLGDVWNAGDLLTAAIGQSDIMISPLQMAEEAMMIANRGVRYKPYMIDSVWDYAQNNQISKTTPEVAYDFKPSYNGLFDPIIEGMKGAALSTPGLGTLFPYEKVTLANLPKPAAIKTGTPQQRSDSDTNSAFIGFYPADDPEIVFAGYIEKGEYSKYMIRPMLEAYYGDALLGDSAQNQN